MRVVKRVKKAGKSKAPTIQIGASFVGTAWCIHTDRFLVTAHHILNGGQPRNPEDRFYAFTVPGNGLAAYAFPITGFPFEGPAHDLAVLEVGPAAQAEQHIPAVPVTFDRPPDGAPVLTYGFPAPAIAAATFTQDGTYRGGQFFLKGHANEGIVSAQYEIGGVWHFEFNVGWHHGESGGPVFRQEPLAAFAVMQHYRSIETPLGKVAGPHCGRSLAVVRDRLIALGATVV